MNSTATSLRGATRTVCTKCFASDMFQATSRRSAASALMGRYPSKGASTSTAASTTRACTAAETGLRPPERMLVAVRAMAPVAGMPPKNGAITLPTPWASSSASGSCRVRAMPSATTAERSDSIAPSIAMAKALPRRARNVARSQVSASPAGPAASQGSIGSGGSCGMPRTSTPFTTEWNRLAMVATSAPAQVLSAIATSAANGRATSGAGTRFVIRGTMRSR
ncbi:MAG: hypothetical protein QM704_13055 [Anaeromyxobacteraceae bacterium]